MKWKMKWKKKSIKRWADLHIHLQIYKHFLKDLIMRHHSKITWNIYTNKHALIGLKQFDFVTLDISGETEALEDKSTRWAATSTYFKPSKDGRSLDKRINTAMHKKNEWHRSGCSSYWRTYGFSSTAQRLSAINNCEVIRVRTSVDIGSFPRASSLWYN